MNDLSQMMINTLWRFLLVTTGDILFASGFCHSFKLEPLTLHDMLIVLLM